MNLSRNELCSCGSGKKVKKCCGRGGAHVLDVTPDSDAANNIPMKYRDNTKNKNSQENNGSEADFTNHGAAFEINEMPIFYIYMVPLFLIIGAFELQYSYYTFLRVVVFVFSLFSTIISKRCENKHLYYVFAIMTIVFNPFFPIHLSKEVWIVIDIAYPIFIFINRDNLINANLNKQIN